MKVDGRCHCGEIRYEAEVDPARVAICHCTDCQMLSGSGWRIAVQAPAESFVLRSGQPRTYVKTAESGARRTHAFCGSCGSPVYSCAVENPPTYSLRVGCLEQRAQLPPQRQQWCQSAVPWSANLSGVPEVRRQ